LGVTEIAGVGQQGPVPGPGGVPLRQPITVRRVMSNADFDALTA